MTHSMRQYKRIAAILIAVLAAVVSQAYPRVFIVNVYPGDKIYELEGHTALVVADSLSSTAYNYGVFDFNSPNFVYRFVKGETDYMLAAYPFVYFQSEYESQGRRMVAHELNLDSAQTRRLEEALLLNLQPQNRIYRYNYVRDNCATRPLSIVEKALGDTITLGPAPFEAQPLLRPTFRNVMRMYHSNYPWYQFGIDLALGSGIDKPISRREIAFAPAELDGMLKGATADGKPLVKATYVQNDVAPDAIVSGPTPWYLTPLFVCWVFLAVAIAVTWTGVIRKRLYRGFDAAFFSVLGLTGCLLTFLIFVSVHEATSPNWLYIWLNPLCFLVPVLSWIPKAQRVLRYYFMIYSVAIILMLAFWWWIPQSANPAFFPLMAATLLRSVFRAFPPTK
ncbi:MAG: DUF4105 domain-containing protein [Muribaculaceae bacterium]|nr:DUF4105 domain-containing protein [Muribaculaceae bacterium]